MKEWHDGAGSQLLHHKNRTDWYFLHNANIDAPSLLIDSKTSTQKHTKLSLNKGFYRYLMEKKIANLYQ